MHAELSGIGLTGRYPRNRCQWLNEQNWTGSARSGEKRGKRARQRELAKRLVFGHFFLGRALGCSPFMIDRISLKSYPFFESS